MFGDPEKKLLRKALALYAGERVVAKVLAHGEQFLVANSETVDLTLLYFDIGSFTDIFHQLSAASLFEWERAYAEAITDAVARSDGTFDTFVGCAGSAWWLAREDPRHAEKALNCAQSLIGAMENLNRRSAPSGLPVVHLRFGIHTGQATLGNFGSSKRLRYCVLGDAVNLAARLCGPGYKQPVILSRHTYNQLRVKTQIELLGKVPLKGGGTLEIYGVGEVGLHAV